MTNLTDKSPVYTDKKVHKSGNTHEYGYVVLKKVNANDIEIMTCWAENCGANDKSTVTVTKE